MENPDIELDLPRHKFYLIRHGKLPVNRLNPRRKVATGLDRVAGLTMVFFGGVIFMYYTIWIIVLPFVESGHMLHTLFLPRMYAVIIPVVAGVVLLGVIGLFTAMIVLKNTKKQKKSN